MILQIVNTLLLDFVKFIIHITIIYRLKQQIFLLIKSSCPQINLFISPNVPSSDVNLSSPRSLLAMAMNGLWLIIEKTQP